MAKEHSIAVISFNGEGLCAGPGFPLATLFDLAELIYCLRDGASVALYDEQGGCWRASVTPELRKHARSWVIAFRKEHYGINP